VKVLSTSTNTMIPDRTTLFSPTPKLLAMMHGNVYNTFVDTGAIRTSCISTRVVNELRLDCVRVTGTITGADMRSTVNRLGVTAELNVSFLYFHMDHQPITLRHVFEICNMDDDYDFIIGTDLIPTLFKEFKGPGVPMELIDNANHSSGNNNISMKVNINDENQNNHIISRKFPHAMNFLENIHVNHTKINGNEPMLLFDINGSRFVMSDDIHIATINVKNNSPQLTEGLAELYRNITQDGAGMIPKI
jgi:hypothetical protein